jgi:hypothetical protein
MIQTFDAQLQVVLRALQDVVAPALTGAEKHVIEQLQLSIVTLSYVKKRLPDARRYFRMELSSYVALSESAVAISEGHAQPLLAKLTGDIAAGNAELQRPEADIEEYRAVTMRLRERLAALSNAVVGTRCKETLDRMILEKSGDLLMQNRLWCAPFGFEPKPEALPRASW